MECQRWERADRNGRYVQLRLAGLVHRLTAADIAHGLDPCILVDSVLAEDPEDEELALIALERDELGYLTVGHVAAILTWVINQPSAPTLSHALRCTACRRALTDDRSRRRGYGPVCWEKLRRGVT